MENYGICSYLDISTIHCERWVLEDYCEYRLCSYDEGAFFWIPSDECELSKVNESLQTVMRYALERGCYLIRFDAEGLTFPEFKEFDW